ncbi:Urease accessory protein ureF [Desulfotomaculum nigrificans CO-1-SRB]|uniref:Urease accessory protein UreF n=1 Tax=Desulfotomaculum nigrificans (strain DSM 14880 / VKM B-2319 / CO-1-SRB) TaxID=868595 RepID=F6B8Y1_DESCC|nr:urease accessory protein UreF [Desulfotomaculum nigrificans]AEF93632.1 Urease accessory protein ureF [Desulfotomaculum nigrificans CO-1-SRB]
MLSNRLQDITSNLRLLSLLQISDSFFPTGSFTQSYGLETYVQKGLITSKEDLVNFLTTYLLELLACSDCLAMLLAYRAGQDGSLVSLVELDQILAAQKIAREGREASVKTGNRMLQTATRLFTSSILVQFSKLVKQGKTYGHHAVVFGLMGQAIGLEEKELAFSFVYSTTAGMVNNAVRLIPLGQNEGQWVLKELQVVMEQAVEKSLGLSLNDLGSAAPALEIRGMQHERLYSRLFMS